MTRSSHARAENKATMTKESENEARSFQLVYYNLLRGEEEEEEELEGNPISNKLLKTELELEM